MSDNPYPEHAKLLLVQDRSQAIGEFLDETAYVLAEYQEDSRHHTAVLVPVADPITVVLAKYFGIDLDKIEAEKRAMLRAL
jgi:hypothetical protein